MSTKDSLLQIAPNFAFAEDGTPHFSKNCSFLDLLSAANVFIKLTKPSGGIEWIPLFIIHQINKEYGIEEARAVARRIHKSPNRQINPTNLRYAEWVISEGFYKAASVEAMDRAKSSIWDAKTDTPVRTSKARFIIKHLKKGISWTSIKKLVSTELA